MRIQSRSAREEGWVVGLHSIHQGVGCVIDFGSFHGRLLLRVFVSSAGLQSEIIRRGDSVQLRGETKLLKDMLNDLGDLSYKVSELVRETVDQIEAGVLVPDSLLKGGMREH
jgi:hypothetical protein